MELNLRITSVTEAQIAIDTLNGYIAAHTDQARNQALKSMTVSDLGLGTRAHDSLVTTAGVGTVAQLISMSEKELRAVKGMGSGSVDNIKEALAK